MEGQNPLTLVRALVSGASSPAPEGDISALLDERRKIRKQLDQLYRSIIHSLGGSDARLMEDELKHLQAENRRLKQEHALLQRGSKDYSSLRRDDLCLLLARAEADLDKAVDQLTAANKDRKQLQTQKDSLVEQLKSLHGTVEERDKQMTSYLTKFNEEFQQRVQQGEEKVRQLGQENKALEKERWDLMKKAKKLSEDKVILGQAIEQRDLKVQALQSEVDRLQLEVEEAFSQAAQEEQDQSDSVELVLVNGSPSTENDASQYQSQSVDVGLDTFGLTSGKLKKKKSKLKSYNRGSLSRIFSKITKADGSGMQDSVDSMDKAGLAQSLTTEQQDNWKCFQESKHLSMMQWKGPAVAAWLELAIGLAPYAQACRENIKSGRMMMEMSSAELEKGLGVSNPLHKRKLKLALDDQRSPESCKYPHAGAVDHIWVSRVWCYDLGLPQLSETLFANLVDGRVLNVLTKDDLKKYLKITTKVQQLSFLAGVELLRMHYFQKDTLREFRETSRNPVYWTNAQVQQWLVDIDMREYAPNIQNSGVHGALLVFEQTNLTADLLATILDIPNSKPYVKKHLHTELNTLLVQGQNEEEMSQTESRRHATVSTGSFQRTASDAALLQVDRDAKIRWSLREATPKRTPERRLRSDTSGTTV